MTEKRKKENKESRPMAMSLAMKVYGVGCKFFEWTGSRRNSRGGC